MQRGRNGGTDAESAFLRPKSVVLHVFMRTKFKLSCYSRASTVVSIRCYTVESDAAAKQVRLHWDRMFQYVLFKRYYLWGLHKAVVPQWKQNTQSQFVTVKDEYGGSYVLHWRLIFMHLS